MSTEENPPLIAYPCEWPLKVFGKSTSDVVAITNEVLNTHAPNDVITAPSTKQSGTGKYTAVTVVFNAQSAEQVGNIVQALKDHPDIILSL